MDPAALLLLAFAFFLDCAITTPFSCLPRSLTGTIPLNLGSGTQYMSLLDLHNNSFTVSMSGPCME